MAPGRLLAGRYTVLDFLGQGGMGVVVAAYDSRLDRRVALKLLRHRSEGSSGGEEQARLVREAQAMAQLSHPNVLAVYDSGTLEDGALFIALEYVEGQTLRQWAARQPRSWRQVLAAYLAAGRGLAAAHAAGLIHRDFKPDNVLVGHDGRVRVMDFGLARTRSARADPNQAAPMHGPAPLPAGAASPREALTVAGSLMGTPRYMAPELLLQARPADVRTDVFAFCVALYEALYGQQPFPGNTFEEVVRAHGESKVRPPPASSEVPAWVASIVLQGLRAEPSQRPGSIEEVLAALEDDPEERRLARTRAVALASGLLVLGAVAGWGWVRQQSQVPVCGQMERRLAGIWDEPVKAKVQQALLGTGVAYAPDTAQRVSTVLDGYASAWVKMRTEVCEAAAQEQDAQPHGLETLRESCLERRRSQLRALTELLSSGPDRALVDQAVQAAQALPGLEYCADAQALLAAVPPPEEPALRARVETLQEQVDRLEALYEAGKFQEGLKRGALLLKQVEPVPYPPLQARALYAMALLREGSSDYAEAQELARQAITLAARGKDAQLMAKAWSQLLFVVGVRQERHAEALGLVLPLEAAVELAGDELVRADADNTLGNLFSQLGRHQEALPRHERALALREKAQGLEHPHTALSLGNLGRVLHELGRYEEALRLHERALALREKMLGPDHPLNMLTLNNLGMTLQGQGRYEEARQLHERALALRQKAMGPDDPLSAYSLIHLGGALWKLGRYEESQQRYERALALREKALGPTHPRLASALLGLGELQLARGRPAEALLPLERAVALAQGSDLAEVRFALARALWELKRELPRARLLATQAQEHWRSLGHTPHLTRLTQWLAEHPGEPLRSAKGP
jgi:serine/threonine-protein kinase